MKTFVPDLGLLYPLFVTLVLTGSANAVNLTHGLDGLAIGSFGVASATFTLLAYAAGNAIVADYLGIANVNRKRRIGIDGLQPMSPCGNDGRMQRPFHPLRART